MCDREWWEAGHGGWLRRLYPRRLLRMAHHPAVRFVAVSGAIRQRAIEYGIPEEKVSVCHIGVDTERFVPGGLPLEQRHRRILYVGRMVEKKAPLLMVRAFAALRARVPDAELVMIGDGPLLSAARKLAQALDVPIVFAGACNSDAVLAHLHEARVFCLPSVTAGNGDAEGFGLVLMEAQACGVPVVTSARGGVSEGLLQSRTGDAVPEGDMARLVDRLCVWLQDDALSARAATATWQFARDAFNIRRCTQQLEMLYDGFPVITSQA
jgi:glycosyltransferase involved in cell wall biosynthesis